MNIQIIDNLQTFQAIRSDWEYIYNADPQAQFFISWIWILAKLKKHSEYKIPWFILAVKLSSDASDYVGFFPLIIELNEHNPGDFYNQLSLVGVTDADHPGLICLPEYEEETVFALAQYIQQQETWSIFELKHIQTTNTRINLFLKSFAQENFHIQQLDQHQFKNPLDNIDNHIIPYLVLPDNWNDYLQQVLSSNTRQKIRRFLRKIEDSNEFRITEVNADNLDRHIEILIQLWQANWEGRKSAEQCQAIVRAMRFELYHCFENNCLSLLVLWKEDKPLGAIANLIDFSKKSILFFVGGRDESFKDLPPGFVLHAYAIQSAIKNGFKIYDFLVGNEAYKYSFGAKERYLQNSIVERQNWINRDRKIDVRTLPLAVQISKHYHRANRLIEAEKGYSQILKVQPKHPEVLYSLGTIQQIKGEYQTAENLLRSLLQVQPNDIKAWFSLGNLHYTQGQLSDAEKAYQQALNLEPESSYISSAIYHNLGYTLQQQGKWEEAIACYQKAHELQPDSIEADVILANALHAQGKLSPEQQIHYATLNNDLGNKRMQASDLKVAIEYYRYAIVLNAEWADAHYNLGLALEKQNNSNWSEASACYQQALKFKPDYLEADVRLANLLHAQGKLSPEQQVHYAVLNNDLGNSYQDKGDLKLAIEYYHQAIALNVEWADAHYNLGLALEKQNNSNWSEASACYQQALKFKPDYLEADVRLANLLHAQGKLSPEQQVHYAVLNNDLGNSYQDKGDLELAIEYYHQAIALNADWEDVRYNLRLALQKQKDIQIKVSFAKQ